MKYLLKVFISFTILFAGCTMSVDNSVKTSSPGNSGNGLIVPDAKIKVLLVAPAQYSENFVNETDDIYRKKKGDLLSSMVYDELAVNRVGIELIPHFETLKVYNDVSAKNPGYSGLEISRLVAEQLDADSVLLTRISRYSERKGSDVGVTEPASVSLTFELYSAGTGKMLWLYHYGETQEPLLSNVSNIHKFIKRGGKWITADELAREIVKQAVLKLESAINNK